MRYCGVDSLACLPWVNRVALFKCGCKLPGCPQDGLLDVGDSGSYYNFLDEVHKEKYDELRELLEPFVLNLRFLHRVTVPLFFLDIMVEQHPIKKAPRCLFLSDLSFLHQVSNHTPHQASPSFRESLYYSTMHSFQQECGVIVLQLLTLALVAPAWMFCVITWVTSRNYNFGVIALPDYNWGTLVTVLIAVYCICTFIQILSCNMVGFGNRTSPVEFDRAFWPFWRVRTKNELMQDIFAITITAAMITIAAGQWELRQRGCQRACHQYLLRD